MNVAEARSFWDVHLGHVLMLGGWLLVVAVCCLRNARDVHLRRSPWLYAAAAATVLSGAVHLAVTREHFEESALYGWFFLVLTIVQLAWAARLVLRPRLAWLFAGAAGSLLVVLLWLATRTIGIPLGAAAGEREAFGLPDLIASGAEVGVVVFALLAMWPVLRPVPGIVRPA
ncbi:hypothetical protein D9V37_13125 [Nocardioides mangrovicus]|uniref:Uncharacterized protein n=1 Tax=Nocardioides mangrovicus TaxID=2478913 RepID=A0A3L8P1G3_9ACTN|nr:hypothetical protein [Nocardioides mangrovicus]RLV48673.1 hypothetical protein D9V37_13125 [Nocardioides mangrovicus]